MANNLTHHVVRAETASEQFARETRDFRRQKAREVHGLDQPLKQSTRRLLIGTGIPPVIEAGRQRTAVMMPPPRPGRSQVSPPDEAPDESEDERETEDEEESGKESSTEDDPEDEDQDESARRAMSTAKRMVALAARMRGEPAPSFERVRQPSREPPRQSVADADTQAVALAVINCGRKARGLAPLKKLDPRVGGR
jgi:hypothetical protein